MPLLRSFARPSTLPLFALLAAVSASGQETRGAAPGSTAVRPTRDVSARIEKIRAKHDVPALAAARVDGRDLVALGAAGLRRANGPEQVTTKDLFHLGSCTKSMTATLCA